jgi:hypothetical protein
MFCNNLFPFKYLCLNYYGACKNEGGKKTNNDNGQAAAWAANLCEALRPHQNNQEMCLLVKRGFSKFKITPLKIIHNLGTCSQKMSPSPVTGRNSLNNISFRVAPRLSACQGCPRALGQPWTAQRDEIIFTRCKGNGGGKLYCYGNLSDILKVPNSVCVCVCLLVCVHVCRRNWYYFNIIFMQFWTSDKFSFIHLT